MPDLYIATQAFQAVREGVKTIVRPSEIAEDGHWLIGARPDAFKPLEVAYTVPKAKPKAAAKTPAD